MGIDAHDLIPGCEYRNSRTLVDLQWRLADRCGERNRRVIQALAALNQDAALPRFRSRRHNIFSRNHRFVDLDLSALLLGVLDHHYGVGPERNWRSSHDRRCLSSTDLAEDRIGI